MSLKQPLIQRQIAILLLLSLTLCAAKCSDSQARKASQASDSLAASINAAIILKRDLARAGKLSPAEELKITEYLFAVNAAAITFHEQVKNTKELDGNSKAQLAAAFSDVSKALQDINSAGVFKPSNPDTQRQWATAIAAMNAAANIIQNLVK